VLPLLLNPKLKEAPPVMDDRVGNRQPLRPKTVALLANAFASTQFINP